MVDSLIVSLRLLSFIVVLGFQLVIPQTSIEHRKVPQRIEEQSSEDSSAGIPGIWGSWGPWSACSRSCSGGVMEQTRPCLPSYYHDRAYSRPGQQYPALERTLAPQHSHHREDPLTSYSGHVISAIRTSVPLHRNEDQLQRGLWASVSSTSRNDSHLHRGTLRGSRHSQRHRTKPERRNRNQSPIGPGKYGYGKVPYILPLQTDTGQLPQKTRRQRQSTRNQAYEQNQGLGNTHNHPSNPSVQHGNLYQEERGPQVLGPSIYQQASTHSQAFPASQSLFHGTDSTHHGSASRQPFQGQPHPPRAGGIVCIGAYKQYKLCNTNMCPESSRNIREVQCASYNNKPFMGRFYEWEPFAEDIRVPNLRSPWSEEEISL